MPCSFPVTVVFLITGIVCARSATAWEKLPEACKLFFGSGKDVCDSVPLTVTTAVDAVSVVCLHTCAYVAQ